MQLLELFTPVVLTEDFTQLSPVGSGSNEELGVDWVGDLKFFIDNDSDLLNTHIFPAIKQHSKFVNHPRIHKVYVSPLTKCLDQYCDKFDIEDRDEHFTKADIIALAKLIAAEYEPQIIAGEFGKYSNYSE